MSYSSSYSAIESRSMFFRRKRDRKEELVEKEIQAIRQETLASVDKLNYTTEKVVKTLEKSWDVNIAIWVAIGGANRGKH